MQHIRLADNRANGEVKSFDATIMLGYGVACLLLLIAIYAISVNPETAPSDLISALTLP